MGWRSYFRGFWSSSDSNIRTGLENVRYGAFTEEDILFLCGRIASDRPGYPHLEDKELRNVSIITAHNIDKDKLQKALWDAPPSTTAEQIPGCLRLCPRLPVMIKSNEATELYITKGQEAVVVCWDSNVGPDGQQILDNLFLELVNPPRSVYIAGLPENVIPISRTSRYVTALL
ncbi:hypothetical protein C8R45DRAFT_1136796 [Mycena sanguinolenta]|nr:hypothetical protein C8R45DRAFT_1136796 [Mycena sanguinolenta]